jgi:hypothetical protein
MVPIGIIHMTWLPCKTVSTAQFEFGKHVPWKFTFWDLPPDRISYLTVRQTFSTDRRPFFNDYIQRNRAKCYKTSSAKCRAHCCLRLESIYLIWVHGCNETDRLRYIVCIFHPLLEYQIPMWNVQMRLICHAAAWTVSWFKAREQFIARHRKN